MKKAFLFSLLVSFVNISYSQTLKFEIPNNLITNEEKSDHTVSIKFSMTGVKKEKTVVVTIDDPSSSASKSKDYTLSDTTKIKLDSANKYTSKVDIVIKSDDSPLKVRKSFI